MIPIVTLPMFQNLCKKTRGDIDCVSRYGLLRKLDSYIIDIILQPKSTLYQRPRNAWNILSIMFGLCNILCAIVFFRLIQRETCRSYNQRATYRITAGFFERQIENFVSIPLVHFFFFDEFGYGITMFVNLCTSTGAQIWNLINLSEIQHPSSTNLLAIIIFLDLFCSSIGIVLYWHFNFNFLLCHGIKFLELIWDILYLQGPFVLQSFEKKIPFGVHITQTYEILDFIRFLSIFYPISAVMMFILKARKFFKKSTHELENIFASSPSVDLEISKQWRSWVKYAITVFSICLIILACTLLFYYQRYVKIQKDTHENELKVCHDGWEIVPLTTEFDCEYIDIPQYSRFKF